LVLKRVEKSSSSPSYSSGAFPGKYLSNKRKKREGMEKIKQRKKELKGLKRIERIEKD